MADDAAQLRALRDDLAELTSLHAPSGAEQPVVARLRELFAPLVDSVAIDHMGNLTATRDGPADAPHVVISAHSAEIGAQVAGIGADGLLSLRPLGGVQSRLLEGRAVWVNGHPGVIGARSGHLTPPEEQGRGARIEDLYVDLGVDDAASVAALGVRIGDPVELLDLRDLAAAVALVEELVTHPPTPAQLAFLPES
jgi:endoglucanase